MHGKTSEIYHNNEGVFKGIKSPFISTRYHSLVVERASCPECFDITSWTEMMKLWVTTQNYAHRGVQFHPESILRLNMADLLRNFLENNG